MTQIDSFVTTNFTQAKQDFTGVMSGVVRGRRPQRVTRGKKEHMVLMDEQQMRTALAPHASRFAARVIFDEGAVSVSVPAFSVIGSGETLDAALADTRDLLNEFCNHYLAQIDFYAKTDRAFLFGAIMLWLVTPDDEQAQLLVDASAGS